MRTDCPRCHAMGWKDPDCPICELLSQLPADARVVATGIVVIRPGPPPESLPRFLMRLLPTLASAVVFGVGATNAAAVLFGASELTQFGTCLVGAVVGMVACALTVDHISGRRRPWGRKLPPVPARASMPEQIPEPRSDA
jgi:hypothetical protein